MSFNAARDQHVLACPQKNHLKSLKGERAFNSGFKFGPITGLVVLSD